MDALFKPVTADQVPADKAEQVVSALEKHIGAKVAEVTTRIERQLKVQYMLAFFLAVMATTAIAIGGYLAVINP
jgi:hypothetical protein